MVQDGRLGALEILVSRIELNWNSTVVSPGQKAIFFVDCPPNRSTLISSEWLDVVHQVDDNVVILIQFVFALFLFYAQFFVVLWTGQVRLLVVDLFYTDVAEKRVTCKLSELSRRANLVIDHQRTSITVSLLLPKQGNLAIFTLTDCTLVVVAKSLLRPERAFSFQVYFVSAEVGCRFKLMQNRRNQLV